MAIDNEEFEKEQERVNEVVNVIKQKMATLEEDTGGLKGDIIELRHNFWEDVTVNLDEPDDVIESHASIKQQAEMLAERERSHKQYYNQLQTLKRLESNPYFGRIDFSEDGMSDTDKIYLGIASLMDKDNDDFLIYDWRAPISSMYYDYTPGPAQYDTPEGIIEGDMKLKRQFIIRDSLIKNVFDTGITIGDELLQEVLGNQSDTKMKSIVATIQKEQNKIIRDERSKLLIVQGVAGSGKTSAALQRVAYLLYRYRQTLNANNILLFSPNPLFNSYIASVLPELGEENMKQSTFQQYLESALGKEYKIEDPFDQIEFTLSETNEQEYNLRMLSIQFKSSLKFKEIIDDYVLDLGKSGIVFRNIKFRGNTLLSTEDIYNYFYSLDPSKSIPVRMDELKNWILNELKKYEGRERKKAWVEEAIGLLDKEDYLMVDQKLEDTYGFREDSFDDLEREQEELKKLVVHREFKPLIAKVKQLKFLNTKAIYSQIFMYSNKDLEQWDELCQRTIVNLKNNTLTYEDTTPYLYLKGKLEDTSEDKGIKHVFLDEAQDYSPFQIALINEFFPNSKMTVLGDFNQAIYPHTQNLKALLSKELYNMEHAERIVLTRSYRSTYEITEFTKPLVGGTEDIEPFNRHGNKPTLKVTTDENHHESIIQSIKDLKAKGHESIAVICKNVKESEFAYNSIKQTMPVMLMNKKTSQFEKGVSVLPSYLAKGIEFDAVIIYDASESSYDRAEHAKLFYTACTRAMHELHLFSKGPLTQLMQPVPTEVYNIVK